MDTALSPKIGGEQTGFGMTISQLWLWISSTFCTLTKVFNRCTTFTEGIHQCEKLKLFQMSNISPWVLCSQTSTLWQSQLLEEQSVAAVSLCTQEYQDFLHHACSLSAPFPSSHTSSYGGIVNAHTTHAPCPPPFRNHTPIRLSQTLWLILAACICAR